MLSILNNPDWEEAFGYAGEPAAYNPTNIRGALPNVTYELTPFSRIDVQKIYGYHEGEPDVDEWMIYGRLFDGRHFYLEAGCDYTGWDCSSDGECVIAEGLPALIRFGMTKQARWEFNLKLPDEEEEAMNYDPTR